MSVQEMEKLKEALLNLNKAGVLEVVTATATTADLQDAKQAVEAIAAALQVVGKRFQEGEWFLDELVYSGEIAKEAMEKLSPILCDETLPTQGCVVIGTVFGDLHDLGKDIFINFATSASFKVIDLGVNVSVEEFTKAVLEHQPVALGISCLLTPAAGGISQIIQDIVEKGARESLKIIVGGAALTEKFSLEVGADAFAPDAVTGTDIIRGWSEGQ
jgi:methanogenic corrinoid protein MtbC1